ncbi:MAG TPA: hypothetical protein VMU84_04245 [Thermoanaerobaculia bacterium]|nr:hypothetical protein [Thermoanaerobaculia bacterium]
MSVAAERHLFILGPSGAGKSHLARYIGETRRYLHIEIDRFPECDGIDFAGLRDGWDSFFNDMTCQKLSAHLRERAMASGNAACVLTFPSGVTLSPLHIAAAAKSQVLIRYLYGSAADCITSFVHREAATHRNLPVPHWLANNVYAYFRISAPEFEPYRVTAFDNEGKHLPVEELTEAVLGTTQRVLKSRRFL